MDSFIREKLKDKTVGIAGAGGLGSNVAVALARIGIGKLIFIDFDRVEKSNLNRQYYFESQIGQAKVEALKENIKKIDSNVELIAHNKKLTNENMEEIFGSVDILVEAFDDPYEKANLISGYKLMRPEVPIVAASGIGGYNPGENINITRPMKGLWIVGDEDASDELFIAPMVGIVANHQANIVLRILLEEEQDER